MHHVTFQDTMVDETCALCKQPAKQRCGGCQVTYYCSRDHQRLDWKTHRSRCKPFKVRSVCKSIMTKEYLKCVVIQSYIYIYVISEKSCILNIPWISYIFPQYNENTYRLISPTAYSNSNFQQAYTCILNN